MIEEKTRKGISAVDFNSIKTYLNSRRKQLKANKRPSTKRNDAEIYERRRESTLGLKVTDNTKINKQPPIIAVIDFSGKGNGFIIQRMKRKLLNRGRS